jgi:hypothetical protein
MPLSSPDITNIIIGAPTQLAISPYVASRGAGTFYDVGYTMGGVKITVKRDRYNVSPDQFMGDVLSEPVKAEYAIKGKLLEGMLKNLSYLLGMDPATYVTGADPNFTFKWNASERGVYHQVKVVGRGLGTTKVRTFTGWRLVAAELEDIEWKKDGEQAFGFTLKGLEESVTPASGAFQIVDA